MLRACMHINEMRFKVLKCLAEVIPSSVYTKVSMADCRIIPVKIFPTCAEDMTWKR